MKRHQIPFNSPPQAWAHWLVAATMALPCAAQAQTSTEQVYEEIIVTARKRAESMYDVPISINVVDESLIENMGANNFVDLLGSVPSLTAYQNGPGRTRLSIRGVANGGGNDNDTQNQETVGIYLDEIPISLGAMNPELSLFDLKRVEVLRGPQGTLFGAGSMTGTIRMVSNSPNLEEFEGKFELGMANIHNGTENYSAKGLVNVPLIADRLAVRASVYFLDNGGYINNILTGKSDINDGESKGARLSAQFLATEHFTIDASIFHHEYSDNGRPVDLAHTPLFSRDYPSFDGYDDEMDIFNVTLTYDLGWAELVSSTSYFDRSVVNPRSLDNLFVTDLPPGITPHELVDITETKTFVQEIRLASTTDSPLQWTVGAYTDKKDQFYENTFPVPGADAILGVESSFFGAPDDHLYYGFDDLVVETYAFFGEAYYDIGDFTLTAGLRYFNWQQEIEFYQSGLFNGESNSDKRPKGKIDGINPKVNLSYALNDDNLIYVQAAKGFRYGGINGAIPQSVCAEELEEVSRQGGDSRFFEPDEIWNYEVGAKGAIGEGALQYSAAYFHINWADMQTSRSFDCGFGFRENVGDATSTGLELELTTRPIEGLTLSVGGSYIETTLDRDVPNLNAEKGDSAPFVPEISFNSFIEYTWPITESLDGFVWANVQYTDDRGTQFSQKNNNYRQMDDYTIANLRLGIHISGYEVSLFANNVFDKRGVVRALNSTPFDPEATIKTTPRTVGVTVRGNL